MPAASPHMPILSYVGRAEVEKKVRRRSKLGTRRANRSEFERCSTRSKAQKAIIMLSHCANTRCHKPFLRLREGKLFLLETDRVAKPGEPSTPTIIRARQQRQVERYWLCVACAARWTLVYDREHGVALAPVKLSTPAMAAVAQSGVA